MSLLENAQMVQVYAFLAVLLVAGLVCSSWFAGTQQGARTLVVKVPVFLTVFGVLWWASGFFVPMLFLVQP